MERSGKIAVMGDADSVELFRAAGADTFSADNEFEAANTLERLSKEGYAVIYITENVALLIEKKIEEMKTAAFPVVIPIPSAGGSNGFGMKGIKRNVEKAIGADILFGGDSDK